MLSQTDDDDKSIASIDGDSTNAIEQKQRKILDILSKESKRKTSSSIKGYVFGPFIVVNKEAQMCTRCGLFVPSAQTGETIVSTSTTIMFIFAEQGFSHNLISLTSKIFSVQEPSGVKLAR